MSSAIPPNPEDLPVIVVHRTLGGDVQVYADQPVMILEIDEGVPHDRMFLRQGYEPPTGIIHGPVRYTDHGGPDVAERKRRFAEWVGLRLALTEGRAPAGVALQ